MQLISDFWISVASVAIRLLYIVFAVVFVSVAFSPDGRFPGWLRLKPRSREKAAVDKAFEKAVQRASRDAGPFVPVSGVPAAIERVKTDDGPLTVDTVLLSPGEVAVFDASGALVVWFPAPGSDDGSVVCQKAVTILTYADMPQATPRMRDQLRLLKGGRDG